MTGYIGIVFQLFFGNLFVQCIQACQAVGQRIGRHGDGCRLNILFTIRLPQCIKASGHFFIGNLFGKVLNAFNFFSGIRSPRYAIQLQIAL